MFIEENERNKRIALAVLGGISDNRPPFFRNPPPGLNRTMRLRPSDSARLTHVAKVGESASKGRTFLRPVLAIVLATGAILATFFAGRHWTAPILAAHWQQRLDTVPDDQAEMLVASAARLGRPGLPVLVAALGSSRTSVASAGRLWLDRQLKSWENVSNQESQRNVAALAEALAAKLEDFSPGARLDAACVADRLLRWHLDGKVVDRRRVLWLCDRILQAADYQVVDRTRQANESEEASLAEQNEGVHFAAQANDLPAPRPLEIPDLLQEDPGRGRFASSLRVEPAPNVVPLPDVEKGPRASDLADAWAMRGHRLGAGAGSEVTLYPSTGERVLVPSFPDGGAAGAEVPDPVADLSLSECMRRLHGKGLEPLAAEEELRRRGLGPLELAIARRVYHPDRNTRLQLVRELPDTPGVGATEWLVTMAGDEDEEVRLAAVTILATVGDPKVLTRVESIARNDPSERIRQQAGRLAKRRQALYR